MNLLKRVDEELSGFIQFGGILNEDLREEIALIFFSHLYDPDYDARENLSKLDLAHKYPNWYGLMDRLLQHQDLRDLTRNNEDLAFSIAKEALNWCKRIARQFEASGEHFHEESDLKYLSSHIQKAPVEQWENMLIKLDEWYPSHQQSWEFYRKTLVDSSSQAKESDASTQEKERLEKDLSILKQNIINEWSGFLHHKKHTLEEAFLDESFASYVEDLSSKVDQLSELGELLAPFYNFLGHVWNDALGAWDYVEWDKLEEYADSLQRDPHLRELADLLGRWNTAKKQVEEQKMMEPMPERDWKPNPYGKSEIIGIHHSSQLEAMLPSEIALLSSPETEIILSKKYVENKLLTFQYRSFNFSTSNTRQQEVTKIADSDEKGPIIINIDTSGSMFGAPERIAKALALAILEIALKQKRRAYLISFSTGIKTLEMTGMEDNITQMIEFLRMSFHGGTDIQPALKETLKMLEEEHFKKADVLIISDFIIPRLDRNTFEKVQQLRREEGTSFHSLFVTRRPDMSVPPLPIFDNHWLYDLDNPKVIRQTVNHFEVLGDGE
ncbi:MAG: VWA domain-containing protein [Bacteroidetes bacterium]|nr:VWA domain-containing protein [Bacteroidota bacterium]